jgi:hypothetical protein
MAYPGNAYVDHIGLDDYDQTLATPQNPANEWNKTTLPNLTAVHRFAAARASRSPSESGVCPSALTDTGWVTTPSSSTTSSPG